MPTVSMGNSGSVLPADKVSYDNTTSGLEAENVQDAIDEINSNLDNIDNRIKLKPMNITGNLTYLVSDEDGIQNFLYEYDGMLVGTLLIRCNKAKPASGSYVTIAYLEDRTINIGQIYANCKSTSGDVFGDFKIVNGEIQIRPNSAFPSGWTVAFGGQISPIKRELN